LCEVVLFVGDENCIRLSARPREALEGNNSECWTRTYPLNPRSAGVQICDSGRAAQLDDGEMLAAVDTTHRKLEAITTGATTTTLMRPARPWLQPSPSCGPPRTDFLRCLPGQSHMRPSSGSRPLPASILDVRLFPKERNLGVRLLELSLEPAATAGASSCVRENDTRQRNRMKNSRLDVSRPLFGQSDRWPGCHDGLQIECWGNSIVTLDP